MASSQAPPIVLRDLVLVGGGHSHVEVLRSFGMAPMPGVRLTLITKEAHTAYSGMLPGFVSGFYTFDECHVDLNRLAQYAGATLILAPAVDIDLERQRVGLISRPPVPYDALTLDVGITPSAQGVPGALVHATPVKPVSSFVDRFDRLLQRAISQDRDLSVAVVGGGAGGVELAMAVHYRLHAELAAMGRRAEGRVFVKLFSKGPILGKHAVAARKKLMRIMKEKGIQLFEGRGVTAVEEGRLLLDGGAPPEAFDECLWCTQASAPAWLADTGLPLDEAGFVRINECLQSEGGPANVFAVGDVASCAAHPRPKAGVFAVRQGMPLADNLRRLLTGKAPKPYIPQSTFLSLITTGDRYAVGTKGPFCLEGAWLWTWKDSIDRTWMHKYGQDLSFEADGGGGGGGGAMGSSAAAAVAPYQDPVASAAGPEAIAALEGAKMRCGGCGAKVGSAVLSKVLARLWADEAAAAHAPGAGPTNGQSRDSCLVIGLDAPDDAAVMRPPPPGHLSVHSVDFFRSFVADPYTFGAIAANHALGDCHAMGARASMALAIAVVPHGLEAKVGEALYQMLAGALRVLRMAGCALAGGHSSEGAELALGFSVTGTMEEARLLRKGGLLPGQALILTKPLGTGVLFAANARGRAKGRWVASALEAMQQSSEAAAERLRDAGASGCTDVTGFGLIGHLAEMGRASQVRVRLFAGAVPLLEGALDCSAAGVGSSLLPQNMRAAAGAVVPPHPQGGDHPPGGGTPGLWPLLCDPQTAGGFLAGVPKEAAKQCLERLRACGYMEAAIVGEVLDFVATSAGEHVQQDSMPVIEVVW